MRLSELLERPVRDRYGHPLGQVHDVHLVQDGPLQANGQLAFRVHGLIVGRGAFATRLGYATGRGHDGRGEVHGPAVIRWFVRWLHRHARYVPWAAVVDLGPSHVTVDLGVGPIG